MSSPNVFISSSAEGLDAANQLAKLLEPSADCTVWASSVFNTGTTIIESLSEAAQRADFAVFVLTPDDRLESRGKTFDSPRDNLIFELGFLAGSIGISRTFIVVVGDPPRLKIPTDLSGILYLSAPSNAPSDLVNAAERIHWAIGEIRPRTADKPVDFYSCFISYSWNDKPFARRLFDDLQTVGVRCWLDEKDLQVGESLRSQIDRGIQVHDKVLLVLSESSIRSSWVGSEIRHALQLEEARQQTVLFPVRLDDSVMTTDSPELDRVREKYVLDFRDWQDEQAYQRAFSRLVRGLALSKSVESGGRD